jgi:hypothetical protein
LAVLHSSCDLWVGWDPKIHKEKVEKQFSTQNKHHMSTLCKQRPKRGTKTDQKLI